MTRDSTSAAAGVLLMSTLRPSVGCGDRVTRPRRSSVASTVVIVAVLRNSLAASSAGVRGRPARASSRSVSTPLADRPSARAMRS